MKKYTPIIMGETKIASTNNFKTISHKSLVCGLKKYQFRIDEKSGFTGQKTKKILTGFQNKFVFTKKKKKNYGVYFESSVWKLFLYKTVLHYIQRDVKFSDDV